MKSISILGSTGSVGIKTLSVVNQLRYRVVGLTAGNNIKLLEEQIKKFNPLMVSVKEEEEAEKLRKKLDIPVFSGVDGAIKISTMEESDIVVNALSGSVGLLPTIESVKKKKRVALANKDSLIMAGPIIMDLVEKKGVNLISIDSELSAIQQCLVGEKVENIRRVILTASGGAFKDYTLEDLKKVTVNQALNHPTWKMGARNTIDSSTLMNKGLEALGIYYHFGIELPKIEPVINPQSIIHSMVEFVDGSIKAQLSVRDMKIPIQYALTYPKRIKNNFPSLDLFKIGKLSFEKINKELFPCLDLAYEAGRVDHTMPIVLNAANEIAIDYFLNGKIKFTDIPEIIREEMEKHQIIKNPDLDEVLRIDRKTKEDVIKKLGN